MFLLIITCSLSDDNAIVVSINVLSDLVSCYVVIYCYFE